MKLAGVVVLFFPSSEVIENIKTYYPFLEKLYVIDNSLSSKLKLEDYFDVTYLHRGSNIGIAKAYNLALKEAKKEGYDFLLTMDQDSGFDDFFTYLSCIDKTFNEKSAIFSVEHTKTVKKDCEYEKNSVVMSSGNVLVVEKILNIGGFDENLFIDEVDHEICFRVLKEGFDIVKFKHIGLNHELGRLVFIGNKKLRLYSPQRLYYMIRNYLYVRKKYKKDFEDFFKKRDRFLLKFMWENIRHSEEKAKALKFVIKGIYHFFMKKYGKRVEIG